MSEERNAAIGDLAAYFGVLLILMMLPSYFPFGPFASRRLSLPWACWR